MADPYPPIITEQAAISDPPFPWHLPGREGRIHCYREVSSTMDKARDLARAECPSMSVVLAEIQTRGRGRLNRLWDSRTGGLYVTLILRPTMPPEACFKLNFLASVRLVRVLRRRYDIDARIKWPNDILVGRRKLAGMLSEMNASGNHVEYMNIGIGINVNNTPPESVPDAVSLSLLLGRLVAPQPLLGEFLDEFEAGVDGLEGADIVSEWKAFGIPLNREATVVTTQGEFHGTAEDVDPDGALLLRLADGTRKRVLYGDCFI